MTSNKTSWTPKPTNKVLEVLGMSREYFSYIWLVVENSIDQKLQIASFGTVSVVEVVCIYIV